MFDLDREVQRWREHEIRRSSLSAREPGRTGRPPADSRRSGSGARRAADAGTGVLDRAGWIGRGFCPVEGIREGGCRQVAPSSGIRLGAVCIVVPAADATISLAPDWVFRLGGLVRLRRSRSVAASAWLGDDDGGKTRGVVEARGGGCRFPGCESRGRTHAHHAGTASTASMPEPGTRCGWANASTGAMRCYVSGFAPEQRGPTFQPRNSSHLSEAIPTMSIARRLTAPRRFSALTSFITPACRGEERAPISVSPPPAVPHWLALATLAAPALTAAQQAFTPEIALDVRTPGIAAVTADGARVAVTLTSRRDRTDVDHQRFGDPTYISPVSTQADGDRHADRRSHLGSGRTRAAARLCLVAGRRAAGLFHGRRR